MDIILLHGGHQLVLNYDPDNREMIVCSPHTYIFMYITPQKHTPNKFLILIFYIHT